MTTEYRFMQTDPEGETYAIRYEGDTITGVCGPLPHSDVDAEPDPSNYEFDSDDNEWANAQTWRPHYHVPHD